MRLIGTLNNEQDSYVFSIFLNRKGISHQIEVLRNVDWGSADYGSSECRVWIYDEDQMDDAMQYLHFFQEHRHDPQFDISPTSSQTNLSLSSEETDSSSPLTSPESPNAVPTNNVPLRSPMGIVTRLLLLGCCLLFFIAQLLTPRIDGSNQVAVPSLFSSPVEKIVLYDYPYVYELIDRFINLYGYEALQETTNLPTEGRQLVNRINHTPYWQGFYTLFEKGSSESISTQLANTPMFEKIRQGQLWRLVSPAIFHADLFHLFFNMLWLIVLGKQLEQRLGVFRYLLFIVIAAIFSNTSQYLMSGANFVGFSGVLCAMLTFIWVRQRKAPWEGYQIDRATLIFMLIFILAMAILQILSFILEKSFDITISPGIANTAHLAGALMGIILGNLNYFSWRTA